MEDSNLSWLDYRAKRTKAIPDRSLFGSNMEPHLPGDKEKLERLNPEAALPKIKEKPKKRPQPRWTLPNDLAEKLPGSFLLDKKKSSLAYMKEEEERATALLKFLENKAKYYQLKVEPTVCAPTPLSSRGELSHKHKPEDLSHAEEMNRVGLNSNNYNRDKYRRNPPVHQYAYLGNPLQKGMDFNTELKCYTEPMKEELSAVPRHVKRHGASKTEPIPGSAPVKHAGDVRVPRNIEHSFGTATVEEILNDSSKVEKTQERLKPYHGRGSASHLVGKRSTSGLDNYNLIGSIMRSNIAPQKGPGAKSSLVKDSYTWDVWDKRKPDPDVFRYHRDDFTQWNEAVVVQDRVMKAWDTRMAERLRNVKQ